MSASQFVALYAFEAEEEGELSVSKGDVLRYAPETLSDDTRDDWIHVCNPRTQRTGYVPVDYLNKLDPAPSAAVSTATGDADVMRRLVQKFVPGLLELSNGIPKIVNQCTNLQQNYIVKHFELLSLFHMLTVRASSYVELARQANANLEPLGDIFESANRILNDEELDAKIEQQKTLMEEFGKMVEEFEKSGIDFSKSVNDALDDLGTADTLINILTQAPATSHVHKEAVRAFTESRDGDKHNTLASELTRIEKEGTARPLNVDPPAYFLRQKGKILQFKWDRNGAKYICTQLGYATADKENPHHHQHQH